MTPRRALSLALQAVALACVLALLLGQVAGQPAGPSYVETGSMAPTLRPLDGFVAVPAALAGPPAPGDVVTYRAERLHGGGLVTHRVVAVTDRGYVTRGDANAFTDQQSVEPPVRAPQVVATALAVDGHLVVIPGLGRVVTAADGLAGPAGPVAAVAAIGVALVGAALALDVVRDDGLERRRDRTRARSHPGIDARLLAGGCALVLVLALTAGALVPGGVTTYGVVSADADAPGPRVLRVGTTETTVHPVVNGGFLPVVAVLEPAGAGVDVTPREATVPGRSRLNATVALTAPPRTGYYRNYVRERRYPALLPPRVLLSLYAVHPWLPLLAVDALVGGATALAGLALLGRGRIRAERSRRRDGAGRWWPW
ncbi:MAG: S26 family signal peptidase [Halobacteriaceae archaeon]